MREFLFRAWDSKKKQMSRADRGTVLGWREDRYIVMQYTGLKDKNRKEIFEGDIIFSSHIEDQKAGPVKWSDIHHAYIIDYPRRPGDVTDQWQDMHGKEHCYEVIGNIYENPEILK